jgi:hypothetical protein
MNLKSKQTRPLLIGLLAASLIIVGAFMIPSVRAYLLFQQTGSHPGTLDYYAEQALAQGLTEYHFSAGIYEYRLSPSWDDVVSRFSFVVAEPIEVKSSPTQGVGGDDGIQSWYRFRVIEQLSSKPPPFVLGPLPSDLQPAQTDQLWVFKPGGILQRNGVQLVADELSFPAYSFGQRYLLILYLDPTARSGAIIMGSQAVYSVTSSGVLSSVDPLGSVFEADLATRYNNSLDQLRAALNGMPSSTPTPTPTPTPCNASAFQIRRCQQLGGDWDYEICSCSSY